jgi:hypothetical protein
MSERQYRLLLGIILITFLFFHWSVMLYIYIGMLFFEGVSNWRIPFLVSRLRYGKDARHPEPASCAQGIPFDVERAFRLIIGALLVLSVVLFPEALWFVPWFLGFALSMAGITGVCPMAMALKKAGFRS